MNIFSITALLILLVLAVSGLVDHLYKVDESKKKIIDKYLEIKKGENKSQIESSLYRGVFWTAIIYMLVVTIVAQTIEIDLALYAALAVVGIEAVEYVSRVINIRKISNAATSVRDLVIREVEYEYKTRFTVAEIIEVILFSLMFGLLIF